MALLGLAFSTLLVHLAAQWSEAPLVVNAANLIAFGSLWVFKYLIFDAILFKVVPVDDEAEADEVAGGPGLDDGRVTTTG
jgi:hypothetical protein